MDNELWDIMMEPFNPEEEGQGEEDGNQLSEKEEDEREYVRRG